MNASTTKNVFVAKGILTLGDAFTTQGMCLSHSVAMTLGLHFNVRVSHRILSSRPFRRYSCGPKTVDLLQKDKMRENCNSTPQ